EGTRDAPETHSRDAPYGGSGGRSVGTGDGDGTGAQTESEIRRRHTHERGTGRRRHEGERGRAPARRTGAVGTARAARRRAGAAGGGPRAIVIYDHMPSRHRLSSREKKRPHTGATTRETTAMQLSRAGRVALLGV